MSTITDLFGGGKKTAQVQPTPVNVNTVPAAPDAEALRRAGRASLLISTSATGILGNPKTGRNSLLNAT